jgi:hypothetical protein
MRAQQPAKTGAGRCRSCAAGCAAVGGEATITRILDGSMARARAYSGLSLFFFGLRYPCKQLSRHFLFVPWFGSSCTFLLLPVLLGCLLVN